MRTLIASLFSLLVLGGCSDAGQSGGACRIEGDRVLAREADDLLEIDTRSGAVVFTNFQGRHEFDRTHLRLVDNRALDPNEYLLILGDERTLMTVLDAGCIDKAASVLKRADAVERAREPALAEAVRAALEGGDEAGAAQLMEQAAESGHAWAQAALGLMLKNGEGIPADAKRAVYWLEHAASQNHAEGAYQLGALYARGDAGPAKARRALYMAQIAQSQNHPAAQALIDAFQQQRAAERARRP